MTMTVNLQARKSNAYADYTKLNRQFYIHNHKDNKDDFFINQIRREVTTKSFKKLQKAIATAQIMLSSLILHTNPTKAATLEGLPTPESTVDLIQWAIKMSSALVVGIGIIWMIVTRLYYLRSKKKDTEKAVEIGENVIKGITQVILIPTIVFVIFLTANFLLGDSPHFQLPL